LANCLRRAVALATGAEIGREGLEGSPWDGDTKDAAQIEAKGTEKDKADAKAEDETGQEKVLRAGVSLGAMERRLVEMTLEATGGNRSRAAALLGVSLRTVRNKIRNYGLPSWSSYVHD
jgi:two-component system, response regulator FlrC